ncbi:MAG: ATP-binding cassette domain-containing protein [Holosporales bacterium]|jgi:cell division transport system ATP-binding protein|nr:ATP-binding cassette domain-containing protein [Holosporales bacterium]
MGDQGEIVFMDRVSLRYQEGVSVLKSLSLRLFPRSFHFLTGSSGAGKSSLLRLLYLGLRPTAGTLKIFGSDVQKVSTKEASLLRRRVGVVFQDFNLIEHLSVLENVMLPLKVRQEHPSARREQARELLSWVGLEEYMDALPQRLSGGQRQRIAIARAVVGRPDLLLADEPTGNVDDKMARRLFHLFDGLHKMGTCVVIATHSRHFVDLFPHPELHLDSGRLTPHLRKGAVAPLEGL